MPDAGSKLLIFIVCFISHLLPTSPSRSKRIDNGSCNPFMTRDSPTFGIGGIETQRGFVTSGTAAQNVSDVTQAREILVAGGAAVRVMLLYSRTIWMVAKGLQWPIRRHRNATWIETVHRALPQTMIARDRGGRKQGLLCSHLSMDRHRIYLSAPGTQS
jgi:hypothetical protein